MRKTLLVLTLFVAIGITVNAQNISLSQLTPKAAKTENEAKVRSSLLDLEQEYFTAIRQGRTRSEFTSVQTIIMVEKEKVRIQATALSDGSVLMSDLEKLGATDLAKFGKVVNAWIPIGNISSVVALKSLKFIKPVYHVLGESGSVNSEGDSALQAMKARIDFCVDGTGVRVGVISDSYTAAFPMGAANGVASGDLPGVGNPFGFTTPVTVVNEGTGMNLIDEGRAMCEIIHDLAPGAELYFNTSGGGEATYAQAILDLDAVSNCDIIVDDVRYFEEPFYMDGPIAQAVNTVFANGVPYFASAGNYAALSYEAPFRNSGGALNAHDFDPGPGVDTLQTITVNFGSTINLTLQWDDPWNSWTPNSAASDLDVFLFDNANTLVAASTDGNIGNDPTEFFSYTDPNGGPGTSTYRILITLNGSQAPAVLKWVIRNSSGLNIVEYPPTTVNAMATGYGHSNALGANAIAAAFWNNTPAFGTTPPLPEGFTSNGGVQIRYNTSGVAITPVTRNKPNFCAVDGVSNTFFGNGNNFFGTSAAAPHAAAVAALMLQANSSLTPTDVRNAMVASSIDMLTPGFDFVTGSGLIQADVALANVASPCAVSIHDPCACLNNSTTLQDGQFSDSVVVWGPTGQMWEVQQIMGLYSTASPAPPAAPTPIAIGTPLVESPAGSGTYVLTGIHVDSIGYSISVTNGTTVLSISNFCVYPTPTILLDSLVFCNNGDPSPLMGDPGDDNIVSESFTINGMPATHIDPVALGAGIHTIVYTVDGGIPDDVDEDDPGCIQSVSMDIEVLALVSMPCVEEINLSLDFNCEASNLREILLGDVYAPELFDIMILTLDDELVDTTDIWDYVGQKLKYVVISNCDGNTCWGYLNIEDKLGPTISMLPDTMIFCVESSLPARTGTPEASDCGGVESLTYTDHIESFLCGPDNDISQIITRVWTALDGMGNAAYDTQIITVKYLPDSLLHAPEPLSELNCGDDTSPAGIAAKLGPTYGYPYYIDPNNQIVSPLVDGIVCNFAVSYQDGEKIDLCQTGCNSGYKMIRTWTLANWCTGEFTKVIQLIKVSDHEAPEITVAPPEKSYDADAWNCLTDIALPGATVTDNCDEHAKVIKVDGPAGIEVKLVNGKWIALGVGKGVHEFTYTATDCCGNYSSASITVLVVDKTAPVATTKEYIVVSLTRSDDDINDGGIAKVYAEMIDNGSYDNCTGVKLEIRREAGSPKCLNEGKSSYNNNLTYDNTGHEDDHVNDTDGGEYVKFCCEDVGQEHKVWLRVWDDADMDGVYGSAGDHYNETWATVKVEDNSVPKLVVEKDITIFCDEDTSKLHLNLSDTYISVNGRVPAAWLPWVDATCSYEISYRDRGSLTTCNTGSFIRTYRVLGGKDGMVAATAEQTITIDPQNTDPYHDLPMALHLWDKCELTEDDVLANTRRAGYRIRDSIYAVEVPYYLMEWYGRNHNTENGGDYCLSANNYRLILIEYMSSIGEQDDMRVEVPFVDAGMFDHKWKDIGCRVFGRKIIIDEYEVGEGCKKWLVRFEYIDWCNPEWSACLNTVYKYEDETPAEIEVSMSDTIAVDVNCLTEWVTVPHGEDDGGCDVGFHWEVTLVIGDLAQTKYATGNDPSITFTDLYAGKYTVYYKLTDGCGNVSEKEAMLLVLGKDPTPYCISLSSAVMKNGVVELWAKDFDKGSYPNCRRDNILYFTFNNAHPVWSKIDKYHFFMGDGIEVTGSDTTTLYLAGIAQKWIPGAKTSGMLFGCGVGDGSSFPASEIKMTVWDAAGLSDYCEVTLSLVDNQEACGDAGLTIGGTVMTESGKGVEDVEMKLMAPLAEYPRLTQTDEHGEFAFHVLATGYDYELHPNTKNDFTNGVNTLDLVHIQRHILGVKRLNSPYKQIAADANNDEVVRVEDLVVLRKLILGVAKDLGETNSWRFLDANHVMENQPWPFSETMSHTALNESASDHFVAVKVGDVDGTAKVSSIGQNFGKPRNIGLRFIVNNQDLKAGEDFDMIVQASGFQEVSGFQFGLKMSNVQVLSLEGKGIHLDEGNYAVQQERLSFSWSDALSKTIGEATPVMVFKMRALKSGKLDEMIELDDSIIQGEAYLGNELLTTGINLEIRNLQGEDFVVHQNQPNPWKGETQISFELPESGLVKLTVTDITGKLLVRKNISGQQGLNQILISKSELGMSNGLLLYKVEHQGKSVTRKMILVE